MARGNVVTARGRVLNMEELILSSKRPMSMKGVDQKDKIEKKAPPPKQLNIRGFVPSMVGVAPANFTPLPVEEVHEVEAEGPSLADLTAVNVHGSQRMKERPEDATEVANETLREIMGDLEQYKAREADAAPTQTRRSRKAT